MTDTYNTPETLETELNRLVLLLEAVESAWVYAVYDDVPTRDQLIATMRERLAPIAVLERSLAGSGETSPLEFAQQTPVLPNQSAPVICFTGLGNAIIQGHLPNLLDLHREALASTRHRLVFWVRENEWVELLETARNFSSRIAGSFDFREEAGEGLGSEPRVEHKPKSEILESSSETVNEVYLEGVKTRIHALDEHNPNNIRELAQTYSELGQIYQSFEKMRWLEAEAAHIKASRFFAALNDIPAQARELWNAGDMARWGGMTGGADIHLNKALDLYQRINDLSSQAGVFQSISYVKRFQDKLEDTFLNLQSALDIYRLLGDKNGEANISSDILSLKAAQGKFEDCRIVFESLELNFNTLSENYAKFKTLIGMVEYHTEIFDLVHSLDVYYWLEEIFYESESKYKIGEKARILTKKGWINEMESRFPAANASYVDALEIYKKIGDKVGEAWTELSIGNLRVKLFDLDDAMINLRRSSELYNEFEFKIGVAHVKSTQSHVFLLRKKPEKAFELLSEALEICETLGYAPAHAHIVGRFGIILNQLGKLDEAHQYLLSAANSLEKLGAPKYAQRYRDALK
jgi:tetratricopeptide (TPR) repeat protein